MNQAISTGWAALPGTAVLILVAFTLAVGIRRRKAAGHLPAGSMLAAAPFAALLCLACAWCASGLYVGGHLELAGYTASQLALGVAMSQRRRIVAWFDGHAPVPAAVARAVRDLVILVAVALLGAVTIDLAWNEAWGQIPVLFFGYSALFLLVVLIALYLIGQRTGLACLLVPLACAGFGIAQFFVVQFKGVPIEPSDLAALGTAAAVAGTYSYELGNAAFQALGLTGASLFLLSLIWPERGLRRRTRAVAVLANLICGVAVGAGLLGFLSSNRITALLDFDYDHWMPISTYEEKGFIPAFTAMAQDLSFTEPEGYSDEQADQLESQLVAQYDATLGASPERAAAVAQFDQVQPTVIAIMNESFADLSIYPSLAEAGYTGPANFKSVEGAIARGTLCTSVLGGGTANTEFEFLTNNTTAFTGSKLLYQLYNFDGVDNLARQFDTLGYTTQAMHPQLGTNYNRVGVYEDFGFDAFHDIDEFTDVAMYHNWTADSATYDKILELLEKDDAPQFIFDVTMQNHGGYNTGGIPEGELTAYAPAGLTEDENTELNTYLSCINASDRELAAFLDQLRTIGRPVVVVFFGDHQPSVSTALNEADFPDADDLSNRQRYYQTSYLVWANYQVAGISGTSTETIGANELSAQVLNLIGAPLSDYQKALLATRSSIPALSAAGYYTQDGRFCDVWTDNEDLALVDTLQRLQYRNLVQNLG